MTVPHLTSIFFHRININCRNLIQSLAQGGGTCSKFAVFWATGLAQKVHFGPRGEEKCHEELFSERSHLIYLRKAHEIR
jgi:hypothetical protein